LRQNQSLEQLHNLFAYKLSDKEAAAIVESLGSSGKKSFCRCFKEGLPNTRVCRC
jgi:hypothetical protein